MALESPVNFLNDLVASNPAGGDSKSDGDNHIRNVKLALKATFPGMTGAFSRVQAKATAYTAVLNDNTSLFDFSAAADLDLTAAATLGNGWMCGVYARGGAVAIDPNGSEAINGSSTSLSIPQGNFALIWCNGSAFYAAVMPNTQVTTTLATKLETGLQSIWVPAGVMTPQFTNGPSVGIVELTTNDVMLQTLDFDAVTAEYAQFEIRMPKSWNESTVQFEAVWSHPATTTNFGVAWEMAAKFLANDGAMDAAFGTAQTVTDTGGTTDDLYQTAKSSAITPSGTISAEGVVQFRVNRAPSNGSDTMAVNARLHGVTIFYTVDGLNDA